MANGQLLTHLFWWAMGSSLIFALYPTRIVLTPGFIISNYNNFQGRWDKSFPASRGGEFWLAVRESSRGGLVTPDQLGCEPAVGNQAVLTWSECVNRFALCQASDMNTKNRILWIFSSSGGLNTTLCSSSLHGVLEHFMPMPVNFL